MRLRVMGIASVFLAVSAAIAILTVPNHVPSAHAREQMPPLPTPRELLGRMRGELTPKMPGDVDRALQKQFHDTKKFADEQLLFDVLSWRTFVALNWPVDEQGKAKERITDGGRKRWDTWKTDEETFLPDGSKPEPWGTNVPDKANTLRGVARGKRLLDKLSSVHGNLNSGKVKAGDVTQAFKFPIWDQHGTMVRYQILLNEDEFNYIVANDLYSINGQVTFATAGKQVKFPVDDEAMGRAGAMEIKLAWKVVDPTKGDLPGRFLTVEGTIDTGPDGKTQKDVVLGLVGMHISHKTKSSPQWIWSTFIHVDSLRTNSLETFDGKPIPTLFNNPGNPTAAVNTPSQTATPFLDGQTPTQVLALTPIPLATQEVNHVAREKLAEMGSVLKHYELMNTQWPTDPASQPAGPGVLPVSIANKAGGNPTPVYLVNPLMETYFQAGNQAASNQEQGGGDSTTVFGTESCVGCHSSAPIMVGLTPPVGVQGGAFTADFSWLLSHRANFVAPPKAPTK